MKLTRLRTFILITAVLVLSPQFCISQVKIIVVTEEWEPFISKSKFDDSIFMNILNRIFENTKYEIDVKILPWARALYMSKSGEADCLLGAFYSEEREKYLYYPLPIFSQYTGIYKLKSTNVSINLTTDLAKYKVGVVRGAITEKEFDQMNQGNVIFLNDLDQCIKMLLSERVQFIVGPTINIEYLIKKKFTDASDYIERIEPLMEMHNIYCCISKKSPYAKELVDLFNKRIIDLKNSGEYSEIIKNTY